MSRKIKHWQGYGTVEMEVVKKTSKEVIVRVSGDHEYGVARNDVYDAKHWLLDKVIRNNNIDAYDLIFHCNHIGCEECEYYFSPKFGLTFKQLMEAR